MNNVPFFLIFIWSRIDYWRSNKIKTYAGIVQVHYDYFTINIAIGLEYGCNFENKGHEKFLTSFCTFFHEQGFSSKKISLKGI